MNDKLRALWDGVDGLNNSQDERRDIARSIVLEQALLVIEAAGFGPGTSTAADEIERLRAALEAMIYGLPELLDSIGYTDEEGLIEQARAALAGPAASEPQP